MSTSQHTRLSLFHSQAPVYITNLMLYVCAAFVSLDSGSSLEAALMPECADWSEGRSSTTIRTQESRRGTKTPVSIADTSQSYQYTLEPTQSAILCCRFAHSVTEKSQEHNAMSSSKPPQPDKPRARGSGNVMQGRPAPLGRVRTALPADNRSYAIG
jgi:hypothetical protein